MAPHMLRGFSMRVRFLKDWTFRGKDRGLYMIDFKAGQTLRLTREQYAQARGAGVIEELRKNGDQVREQSEDHQSVAEPNPRDEVADR